jgi:hypothetical protein
MKKSHLLYLKSIFQTIVGVIFVLSFSSCETEAGKGGTSTIKGTVIVQEYNKDLTIKVGDPYPAQEVDVFLIYGDDEVHGDKFETGWDGKFEFNYLQEGAYTVYALSKNIDNKMTDQKVPVFIKVNISGKEQVLDVGDINIID